MKRLIIYMFVSAITLTTNSQVRFSVPSLSDRQKYQMAAIELNGSYLSQISFAKSLGKSVEDVARYVAGQFRSTTKAEDFDRYFQIIALTFVTIAPYGSLEIKEQTEHNVTCKISGLYNDFKEGGSIYNVTYSEYMQFWGIVFSNLGAGIGAEYSQIDTDDGLVFTIKEISKKP